MAEPRGRIRPRWAAIVRGGLPRRSICPPTLCVRLWRRLSRLIASGLRAYGKLRFRGSCKGWCPWLSRLAGGCLRRLPTTLLDWWTRSVRSSARRHSITGAERSAASAGGSDAGAERRQRCSRGRYRPGGQPRIAVANCSPGPSCTPRLLRWKPGSHQRRIASQAGAKLLMCSALRRCLAAHVGLCVQEHVERGRLPPSRTSPPSATSATSTAARCAALTRARRATAPTAPGPPAARWTASGRSGSGASHYCPTSSAPQQHLGMWGSPVARAS